IVQPPPCDLPGLLASALVNREDGGRGMREHSHRSRSMWLALLTSLAFALAPVAAAHAAGDPFTFGPAALVAPGPPFAQQLKINDISCPATSLCVAVDDQGGTISTANPTAPTPTW